MSELLAAQLLDAALDAYVDWREECAGVWAASELWSCAPVPDAALAVSAYRAALDREERASQVYAGLMSRLAAVPHEETDTVGDRAPRC